MNHIQDISPVPPVQPEVSHRAKIAAKLLAPAATLLLAAACSNPKAPSEADFERPERPAGTEVVVDLPDAVVDGSPAEQASYYAAGAGDGYADETDLDIAMSKADEATGVSKVAAHEAISAGAEATAKYWAEGAGDGYVDDDDLSIATDYAEIADENGSRGDEAHEAISAGAEATAKYWAEGAGDGYVDDDDRSIAESYQSIADKESQLAGK